jgi:NAD(P)-dependent dehydrogenase (short-subunit alcohol dehydrogenase family)
VLADIQDERGQALADELGAAATYAHVDVTSESDVAAVVDLAVAERGGLDVMFNNAGIVGAIGPIDELPLEEYEFTMAVLLRSVFLGMKHAARVMKPQERGVILSTSSVAGIQGGLGPHVYNAAKTAIVGLTKNVAAELGPWSIRVNAIAPGKHATPMNADVALGDPAAIEAAVALFTKMTPLRGRPGLADDIAHAALWLASDEAGFVSGHTLVVDGGLTTGSKENVAPGEGGRFAARQELIREAGGRGLG